VQHKYSFPCLFVLIVCSSCGLNISNADRVTSTPDFITATLPSTPIPLSTQTSFPTVSTPGAVETQITSTVEGTTTTQLNVRAEPSTASEALGLIGPFAKVNITGKDASGNWFQIVYAGGNGWVRAEYVQVNATVEIPVIAASADSGSGLSGLVIQKINVRNGPGINYESLGTLNPKDVVFITGKDPSGKWIQFEFINGADGKGWGSLEFLQVENLDALPVIGNVEQTATAPASAGILPALQDGDSMQAPLAGIVFSPTGAHALQVNNNISAPEGDLEDWFQFTSFSENVLVEIKCSNNAFRMELWKNAQIVEDIPLSCSQSRALKVETGLPYFLHIQANSSGGFQFIQYEIKISTISP
jgi:uncharacterized protein YraI